MAKGMPTGAKPKAHYPRTDHDFSGRRVYTSKAGLIEPIKPIHSVPNEHFNISVSDFLQSMPLTTAAFLRGRKEFAFYYVPYVQLWSNFGQYMTGRSDKFSSALKGHAMEPRISLRLMYEMCLLAMLNDLQCRFDSVNHSERVLDWNNSQFTFTDGSLVTPRTFSIDLSNRSWLVNSSFMRVVDDVASSFTPNREEYAYDRFGLARWSNMLRKLDLLRFGNLVPVFSPFYDALVAYIQDENSGITTDRLNNLFNMLMHEIDIIPVNYYVSPMAILAYNKIYYTFFRNSYYELDYYVGDYNVDYLQCDSLESSIMDNSMVSVQFLDLFQHQWKKDVFTSLMPDTQFGAVSQVLIDTDGSLIGNGSQIGTISNRQVGVGTGETDSSAAGTVTRGLIINSGNGDQRGLSWDSENYPARLLGSILNPAVNSVNGSVPGLSLDGDFGFDVLALRRAEAIQGYRQTLLRCGNKTKDIMVGIYGVEPVWENDHDPAFIDTFGYDFMVDRVMQTATTDPSLDTYNGKLGDLGGQIARLGSTKHDIKFTTRGDFGVIMPVCYTIFESEYNSYNIDQNNLTLTPEDRFIPDFMNLGFVPVTRRNLSLFDPVRFRQSDAPNLDAVLGYGTRYWEKKIDLDLVHGILCTFGVYDEQDAGQSGGLVPVDNDFSYVGDLAHWVAPRTDMQSAIVTSTKQFYIDPRILNGNFLKSADGRQETDQFINNTYFKVDRVNIISDLGLPQF